MSRKLGLVVATLVSGYSAQAMAYEFGPSSMFSLNGFGTLSAVHSNLEQADFSGTYLQPEGAGYSSKWSFEPDSVFGLQASANYGNWKFVVQGVTRQTADDNYKPSIEWANLRYSFSDDFSARVGRFAMPTYLNSDTRLVHYAITAVRPSVEVYRLLPVMTADGVDLSYKFTTGAVRHTVRAMYGKNTTDLVGGAHARNKDNIAIINDMEIGDFTIHAAFQTRKFTVVAPTYTTREQPYKVGDISVNYDNGKQFVMAEIVRTWLKHPDLSVSSVGYVVNAGQRFGDFTPYVQYGKLRPLEERTGMVGLAPASNTKTVGVRWDFMSNTALKAQYDRAEAENNGRGTFVNGQTGFPVNSSADVFTLALDFVF